MASAAELRRFREVVMYSVRALILSAAGPEHNNWFYKISLVKISLVKVNFVKVSPVKVSF